MQGLLEFMILLQISVNIVRINFCDNIYWQTKTSCII